MDFSYWEIKTWFSNLDFTIVGSGIVGLTCAIHLKQLNPEANILILEKGILPQGASTKNAGFACFGSLSEILEDLKKHPKTQVLNLIRKRVEGLELLRKNLGDEEIGYEQHGGYELFLKNSENEFNFCNDNLSLVNQALFELFNRDVFSIVQNPFEFEGIIPKMFFNPLEGQLHTGKMMSALLRKAQTLGIKILNSTSVLQHENVDEGIKIITEHLPIHAKKLIFATNGFASNLVENKVKPARAQVLITKPIKDLHIKGTFHIDRGYYYFRNIDNRILFGGGRELDFETETTTEFGLTDKVQNRLETLLNSVILPRTDYEIEHRWSGIMGVGESKEAIVKQLSENVYCGVRLGGMGIAIGSIIGKDLAELSNHSK